ncbi:MAG: type II secretion system protein GspN [Desulfobacteraceae bacterium 4572_87]|nr:MAG: type II secretion system protein GspN [Desulfobacteraceae bacterium 4572_87]
MKAGFKYAGYGFYAVVVTVALLYYHFPSEAFKSHLVQMAGRMDPGIIFSTRSLDPSFPPGLRLQGPALSLTERPETAFFQAQTLSIHPGIGSLILGDLTWFFDAQAYGGTLNGHIQSGEKGEINGFSLTLEKVRIHEYAFLPNFGIGDFAGSLNTNITYEGRPDRILKGVGTGDIHISEGKIDLINPFLGLETIPFGKLDIRFTLKKGTLNLTSVSLDGKGFQGSLSGTIALNRIMDYSRSGLFWKP